MNYCEHHEIGAKTPEQIFAEIGNYSGYLKRVVWIEFLREDNITRHEAVHRRPCETWKQAIQRKVDRDSTFVCATAVISPDAEGIAKKTGLPFCPDPYFTDQNLNEIKDIILFRFR